MGDDVTPTEQDAGDELQTQPLSREEIAELLQEENAETSLDQPSDSTS